MLIPLKVNTATTVLLGAVVNKDDGHTPETAPIPAGDLRISKNNGIFQARDNSNPSIHVEDGWHWVDFSADDTDSLGLLILKYYVTPNGAKPLHVWVKFWVMTDAMYEAYKTTGIMPSDMLRIKGNQTDNGTAILDLNTFTTPITSDIKTDTNNLLIGQSQLLTESSQTLTNTNDIKTDTNAIVTKLPATGSISNYDPAASVVDGVTYEEINQKIIAWVEGRERVTTIDENTEQVDLYARDNSTIISTTRVTATERTRV